MRIRIRKTICKNKIYRSKTSPSHNKMSEDGTGTYEDDAGCPGLGCLEEVPDPPGPLAHQHLVKLWPGGVEEWHPSLASHSPSRTNEFIIKYWCLETGTRYLIQTWIQNLNNLNILQINDKGAIFRKYGTSTNLITNYNRMVFWIHILFMQIRI